MEAAFRELDAKTTNQDTRREAANPGASAPADAAIDEEIKIVKKRQPIPKLDAPLLLSPAGIPKLRRISKDRLKFKGKGHEVRSIIQRRLHVTILSPSPQFSDIARLLNTYQLWLDDLYPRAKFVDALTIMEKLGHSKHIQMMRKAWIEEGKPKATIESDEGLDHNLARDEPTLPSPLGARSSSRPRVTYSGTGERPLLPDNDTTMDLVDTPQEEELDALLAEEAAMTLDADSLAKSTPVNQQSSHISPQDDELDALLAEEDAMRMEASFSTRPESGIPARPPRIATPQEDEFVDDLDAMGEMW
jgi:replication fork protection complex subunit Csm3/Swi3